MGTMSKCGVKVGLNGNVSVQKVPGSKGVMVGLNAKVLTQTAPKGRVGGTNASIPRPNK